MSFRSFRPDGTVAPGLLRVLNAPTAAPHADESIRDAVTLECTHLTVEPQPHVRREHDEEFPLIRDMVCKRPKSSFTCKGQPSEAAHGKGLAPTPPLEVDNLLPVHLVRAHRMSEESVAFVIPTPFISIN